MGAAITCSGFTGRRPAATSLKNTTATQGMHARLDQFLSDIRDPKNNLPQAERHRARLCQRDHLPQNRENEPGRRYPVLDDPSLILQSCSLSCSIFDGGDRNDLPGWR